MPSDRIELRRQTFQNVLDDTDMMSLPVVFTGNRQQCEKYAADNGFEFKPSRKYLFGGYFYKKPTEPNSGECLLPT